MALAHQLFQPIGGVRLSPFWRAQARGVRISRSGSTRRRDMVTPVKSCQVMSSITMIVVAAVLDCLSHRRSLPFRCVSAYVDFTSPFAVFEHLLAAGRLPELSRLIAEGTYIRRGVTCLPSMTGYCYYPLLSGIEASRSGVAGAYR